MNDIITSINARLKELLAEVGQLHKARELLGGDTSPVTGKTPPTPAPTPDKPMRAARKPRHIKKHRSAPGALRGRLLTLLRMNRGTVKELVKQLEAASFPFAIGTSHTGCVRAQVVTMKNRKVLASTRVAGRGEVYSIARSDSFHDSLTVPFVDRNKPKIATSTRKTPQPGLTGHIIKTLAQEGVTGHGLTTSGIVRKMEANGFSFTARVPVKSVSGLLGSLLKKNLVSRTRPFDDEAYHYKIRTTTELLDAVREEG